MKKIISISLLSVLLLSSCSIDWNDEKATFKKKQECEKYADEIKKWWDLLDEIFYSKKLNTCVSISHSPSWIFVINDLLRNSTILMKLSNWNKTFLEWKTLEEYNNKIRELKWE